MIQNDKGRLGVSKGLNGDYVIYEVYNVTNFYSIFFLKIGSLERGIGSVLVEDVWSTPPSKVNMAYTASYSNGGPQEYYPSKVTITR